MVVVTSAPAADSIGHNGKNGNKTKSSMNRNESLFDSNDSIPDSDQGSPSRSIHSFTSAKDKWKFASRKLCNSLTAEQVGNLRKREDKRMSMLNSTDKRRLRQSIALNKQDNRINNVASKDKAQLRTSMQVCAALRGSTVVPAVLSENGQKQFTGINDLQASISRALAEADEFGDSDDETERESKTEFEEENVGRAKNSLMGRCNTLAECEEESEEEESEEEESTEQESSEEGENAVSMMGTLAEGEEEPSGDGSGKQEEKAEDEDDDKDKRAREIAASIFNFTKKNKLKMKLAKNRKEARSSDTAQGTLNFSDSVLERDSVHMLFHGENKTKGLTEGGKPKMNKLAQLILTNKFDRYANRFLNAQKNRTLIYPTLKQPKEKNDYNVDAHDDIDEYNKTTEMVQTRNFHRFIITADTQYGILMDGFSMNEPSWKYEVELSRITVDKINAMKGPDRPLFVTVCGDLVDTESSFSTAMASWKVVFNDWERSLVFEQQCKDWKDVWSLLDDDIALVCLCGNHDVGNRPTKTSIEKWSSLFGDDYVAFWVNGTYNIGLNNCLFNDPSGALDLFDEQLEWLKDRLEHARQNNAKQIYVYSHFPWFIVREDETDDEMDSVSNAPDGWGPSGTNFSDYYFHVPVETRQIALSLFKEYNVTACFSGHYHQNVVTQTSWGMPMIITGPLSMSLTSTVQHLFGETTQTNGFRIVDCDPKKNKFKHQFVPLDRRYEYCQPINTPLKPVTEVEENVSAKSKEVAEGEGVVSEEKMTTTTDDEAKSANDNKVPVNGTRDLNDPYSDENTKSSDKEPPCFEPPCFEPPCFQACSIQ